MIKLLVGLSASAWLSIAIKSEPIETITYWLGFALVPAWALIQFAREVKDDNG